MINVYHLPGIRHRHWSVGVLAFLMLVLAGRAQAQVTYCAAANTDVNAAGSLMSNVTFGSINNSTSGWTSPSGYNLYTATTTVIMGTNENLTISIDPPSTYTGAIVSVWIDWNQDGTLAASEWQQVGTNMTNAGSPYTVAIPIPLTATPGTTRMRIRSRGTGNPNGSGDACSSMGSGETEDYNITVVPATACSGTPVAGTALVNPHNICLGQSVTLSLTGNTVASGLTYQWETATSSSGPWTPIGLSLIAPSSSHTPTTSGVVYYRVQVTCTATSSTAASAYDSVVIPNPFPGGTYTIDPAGSGSSNFTSITAAINAIACGITGSIVFNLAPNVTFVEQVTIPSTVGTNSTRTVTFNGNGDTLRFAGTASAPWTLGLNGADHFTFNNLVVGGTNSTNALVVHLWNQADSNTFYGCTMFTNANVTATTAVPFSISGSATSVSTTGPSGNGNTVSGCKLFNGYDGAFFYGNTAGANQNNKVINSRIRDFYRYGVYAYYQTGMTVAGDTVERPTRTSLTTFYGIYLSTSSTGFLVEKNIIRNTHGGNINNTGTAYGIYCGSAGTSANPNRFINNVISQFNGRTSGTFYGMYLSGNYQRVFHNTIAFTDTTTTTGTIYGLYASGTTGMAIRNNNISLQQPGSGIKSVMYFSGTGKNSNFNNLHVSSPGGFNYIGYYSTTGAYLNSLAAWKALGFDSSSVNENPVFAAPASSNYTPTSGQMDNKGDGGPAVATDILNNPRNATTPDIGAYEYTAPACGGSPTAGTATAPASACVNAPFSLNVSGFTNDAGITIQWEESPSGAGMFTPITGATTSTYTVAGINSATDYRAVVTCSNGGSFDITSAVTVSISPFYICYCSPTNTSTTLHSSGYNYITNVGITGSTLNYTSPQSVGTTIPGGYNQLWPVNGSGSNTASLIQGIQYTLTATAAYTSYPIVAWMDYDGSGLMDSSEFITLTPDATGLLYSGTFTIPYSSVTGMTGLRFRIGYTPGFTSNQSCFNYSSGYETEDYVVTVTAAPGCSGTPSAGVAYAVDSTCPAIPLALNDTTYSFGVGITYEWQQSAVGAGTWTAIPGATNPNYIMTAGITSPADFRLKVNCANGNTTVYSNSFTVFVKTAIQCYCIPIGTGGSYGIQSFTTTGGVTNISNTNSGYSSGGYGNFTSMSLLATPGTTINFSTAFLSGTNGFAVWIDWGRDGSFAQFGDLVYNTTSYQAAITGSFNVPLAATTGPTRMRIIGNFLNSNPSSEYCAAVSNGYAEWEDYTINIAPPPTCVPVTGGTASAVTLTSATVSWNQSTSAPALGYYWLLVPQGGNPSTTPISSGSEVAGDTVANLSGLTGSTSYTLFVRAVCSSSDSSFWTGINFATPPVNDSCNNAINIGGAQPTPGTTVGATQTMAAGSCATTTTYANDVWYYFSVGNTPGSVTITAVNTVGDVVLEVLSGTCGSMTELDCEDVPAIGTETIVLSNLTPGIYYVRVYGYLSIQNPFIVQVTGAPLAIKLQEISAGNFGMRNRINWNTAGEAQGDKFELERSVDGRNFSPIAMIAANGNASSYSYWDENPVSGVNYYRLKMKDAAGRYEYSKTVTATVKGLGKFMVEAFPNPATDVLTVKVYGTDARQGTVTVSDITGKVVKVMSIEDGMTVVDMKGLVSGMYLVKYSDNNHSQTVKVTKQ